MGTTNTYINKYYRGGMVTPIYAIVEFLPQNTTELQNLALIVTIVLVVPPMLLIVTMFLLLQLLPLKGGI